MIARLVPSLLLAAATALAAAPPATPAPFADAVELAGVPNIGRVSATLLRGGQPSEEGLRSLASLGVAVVVDLRNDPEQFAAEKALVEGLGMRAVHLPMSGVRTPRAAQVAEFLALLQANADRTVYVHCRRGAERTGVMVAATRIALDGWPVERALAEMKAYRFRAALYPHFAAFVRRLPAALAARPAPAPAPLPARPAS